MRHWIPGFAVLLALAMPLASSTPARGNCNFLPHAGGHFLGAVGTIDRPFAGPDDLIELGLWPQSCASNSPRFVDSNYDSDTVTDEHDFVVSFVFEPPGGKKHLVVVATDCSNLDVHGCTHIPAHQTVCLNAALNEPYDLRFDEQSDTLDVRFPRGTCASGPRKGIPCQVAGDCGSGSTHLCETSNPERPLTGPLKLVVIPIPDVASPTYDPPWCDLASEPCKSSSRDPIVCVDELYPFDENCNINKPDDSFPSFTALPPPNDFQLACTYHTLDPECLGELSSKVRFALDSDGNVLIPMDWSEILRPLEPPTARLLSGSTAVPAKSGESGPIKIPGREFVESYTLRGRRLPALFEPQMSIKWPNELTLFGTVDADRSVLRVARREKKNGVYHCCDGGLHPGAPCKKDKHCPGGGSTQAGQCVTEPACAPTLASPKDLFDFEIQAKDLVGPVEITREGIQGNVCDGTGASPPDPDDGEVCTGTNCSAGGVCVDYRASADDHIAIGGIESSEELHAVLLDERLVERDVNGDGDEDDQVLTVRDRPSGALLPIGDGPECIYPPGCPGDGSCPRAEGRAVVMLSIDGHEFPVLRLEGGVIAFVEDCQAQYPTPVPCTGDVLRVYRKIPCPGDPSRPWLEEITSGDLIPAQDPVIDDWVLQVSESGKVFFRDSCKSLHVLDGHGGSGTVPQLVAPASLVATAEEKAAFVWFEPPSPEPGCPAIGSPDQSGIVHLWSGGGTPENLGCAATELDMSSDWIAALVPEPKSTADASYIVPQCPGPRGQGDFNGDGDCGDAVVHVTAVGRGQARPCEDPSWRNLQQAGRDLGVSESVVAYLRPESAEGRSINRDPDEDDDIMQVYFAQKDRFANLDLPAEGYVLGERIKEKGRRGKCHVLAFHTSEEAQRVNLNDLGGDTDTDDEVLQIFDLVEGENHPASALRNTQQSVRECDWMVCDPRQPYRIEERLLRFVTYECDQGGPITSGCPSEPGSSLINRPSGTDLLGDGDAEDLVMQVLDVCQPQVFYAGFESDGTPQPAEGPLSFTRLQADRQIESVALAGRCVEDLHRPCIPDAQKDYERCPSGSWCKVSETDRSFLSLSRWLGSEDEGTCHRDQGVCFGSEDCPAGLECQLDYTKVYFHADDRRQRQ